MRIICVTYMLDRVLCPYVLVSFCSIGTKKANLLTVGCMVSLSLDAMGICR